MRSLVVDDSPTIRILLRHLLSAYGDCEVAQNGQEALDAHEGGLREGRPYDLICVDLGIPYVDGLTVVSKIRAAEAQRRGVKPSRILVVTATRDSDRIRKAEELGADAHLLKPIASEELVQHLVEFGLVDKASQGYLAALRDLVSMCDSDKIPLPLLISTMRAVVNSIERQIASHGPEKL